MGREFVLLIKLIICGREFVLLIKFVAESLSYLFR